MSRPCDGSPVVRYTPAGDAQHLTVMPQGRGRGQGQAAAVGGRRGGEGGLSSEAKEKTHGQGQAVRSARRLGCGPWDGTCLPGHAGPWVSCSCAPAGLMGKVALPSIPVLPSLPTSELRCRSPLSWPFTPSRVLLGSAPALPACSLSPRRGWEAGTPGCSSPSRSVCSEKAGPGAGWNEGPP